MNYRKLIVLDLDNTLWKGIVGDEVVVPFVRFQRALKDLQERGVLLAIASKNTESIALTAFNTTPGMVLKQDDIVTHKINWESKATNIVQLTEELNLGLQSVVFIDDSPFERGQVSELLREVLVPEWPSVPDDDAYVEALAKLDCFDLSEPTEEDLLRTQMYARERERAKAKSQSASVEDWLKSLGTKLTFEELNEENFPRAVQLLNKTNQMNLTTRRLDEAQLREWLQDLTNSFFTVKVSDRFGDAGLTGIIGLYASEDILYITDFVLSCRVMGRLVEEAMIEFIIERARKFGQKTVVAMFNQTPKNGPAEQFMNERSGFTASGHKGCIFRRDV